MDITGNIIFIDPTRTPSESNPTFKTRTFGIESTTEINFQTKVDVWGFQTIKPETLDGLGIGDKIKVSFSIRCQKTKRDVNKFSATAQNPENISVFTSLDCVKIEVVERVSQHANTSTATASDQSNNGSGLNGSKIILIPQPTGDVPMNAEKELMVWNGETGAWENPAPF